MLKVTFSIDCCTHPRVPAPLCLHNSIYPHPKRTIDLHLERSRDLHLKLTEKQIHVLSRFMLKKILQCYGNGPRCIGNGRHSTAERALVLIVKRFREA